MSTKQNNKKESYSGKQDSYSDTSETKRKRLYSTQSHESEVSCMSQETATTGLSFETDSYNSLSKRKYDRSVSFCLANENEETTRDPCNDSNSRDGSTHNTVRNNASLRDQPNNSPNNFHTSIMYETLDNTSEEIGQERIPRHIICVPANNPRMCSQNSFSEENCRQPLLRGQSTFSRGTINEHPNDSELGSGYVDVKGNFKDYLHPCAYKFDHSQCQKLCSSVKLLKKCVLVLCVFNLILLIALIIVPAVTVIYIQASKDSSPVKGQSLSPSEKQSAQPSCVKCESLAKKIPNFSKTSKAIKDMKDEDGGCCFSDPEKLITILNEISEETVERAKSSISISGPSIINGSVPTPAVHLKSKGNGLINVSIDFVRKGFESTHFVGWQLTSQREFQGLWGKLDEDGASIKVRASGMYFIYTMIQHKNALQSSSSDNMTTSSFGMPHTPLKVTLYVCQHGRDGEKDISSISGINQKHYSTDSRVQHNTYFGRLVYLKENENVYLGISGYDFIHQESDSHYMGLYKI